MEILGLVDLPLWLPLLLSFFLLLYVYGTWTHSVWTSQGVPGPRPWPLVGNLVEMLNTGFFNVFVTWQQKYGRVFGYFVGHRPLLAVTDLDLIREIGIKHYNNFSGRAILRGTSAPLLEKSVFFLAGSDWKRTRSMITPAFSTSKLKLISHFVSRCSQLLVRSIENKVRSNELIDIKEVSGNFTMDVIAGTGFGLETNCQTQEGEPFVHHCKKLFQNAGLPGIFRLFFLLSHAFPFMAPFIRFFGVRRNARFFVNAMDQLVDERLRQTNSQGQKASDLLQMLVEAESDDPAHITDTAENKEDAKNHRRLSKEEIMAQGFLLLIAGCETTATTLQYLTYNLATHSQVQQRVFEEIQEELGDAEPTYGNVSKLKYLEAAIRETLRMFPPVALVNRRAMEAITLNGIHIPAGCGVGIPIYCILHDPEYFPDPEIFNPDRFLGENLANIHPVTEDLAFGYGPRKCLGMRLAMLELKLAAALVFRQFRFVPCAETPDKINLGKKGLGLAIPDAVIKVKAELRSA